MNSIKASLSWLVRHKPTVPPIALDANPSRIRASHAGFQPSEVILRERRRVIFRRIDNTCANVVIFPELGIKEQLPLNRDIAIDLPAGSHGEFDFQCGMGVHRGKIVIL